MRPTVGRVVLPGDGAPLDGLREALEHHDVVVTELAGGADAAERLGQAGVILDGVPETPPASEAPHAHGWHLDEPPAVLVELCLAAGGGDGGEHAFVSARAMLDALGRRFSEAELRPLWAPDAMRARVDGEELSRPVFARAAGAATAGRIVCRFSSHPFTAVTPSGMAQPAFDFCREFVRLRQNQTAVELAPGECVFVRNTTTLTGRRGWYDAPPAPPRFARGWLPVAGDPRLVGFAPGTEPLRHAV